MAALLALPQERHRQAVRRALILLLACLVPASSATAADGPFELNITNGLGAGEPELAIDPVHHTLVISFLFTTPPPDSADRNQGCGTAVSADAGRTWRLRLTHPADPGPTPGDPYHQCSDPTAAAGPDGTVYAGGGWWDTPGGFIDDYNMYVARSGDGGLTWGPSVFATGDRDVLANLLLGKNTGHSDREFLTVDNRTGTLYATATDIARVRRWIVASHDQGRTFGPLRAIDSAVDPELPQDYIPAAANGVLAVSYIAPSGPIFETSTDDGATWTRHPAPIRAQWTAADTSRPGRFAIMSGLGETGTTTSPTVLVVSVTSDYGKTWSKPVEIGQSPSNLRWRPWINYSPSGVLGVGYKTLYSDRSYDFWAAVSRDGGRTFGAPIRLSHAVSGPEPEGGDDFSFVALDNSYLFATWADMRQRPDRAEPGDRSLYFARVPLNAPSANLRLLTCRTVSRSRHRRGHRTPFSCAGGAVAPTFALNGLPVTMSRGRTTYATGTSVTSGHGRRRILLTELRRLTPGRYTLTVRHDRRGRPIVRRIVTTIA